MRQSSPKSIFGRKTLSRRLKDDRLPRPPDHQILEIFPALLGLRQGDLGKDMGRRRLRRHERQLQVINDAIHHGNLREEGVCEDPPGNPATPGIILGHEYTGRVLEAGEEVTTVAAGATGS